MIERVREQLPTIVRTITREIGDNIDQLLDPKVMVIEHFRRNPALVNRIFNEIGKRELKLMVDFGLLFGFLLGIPVALVDHFFHQWWLLPLMGVLVGWTTNKLGMSIIFEPVEERRVLGMRWQGLFLRRQGEVADVYARIISEDVITLQNIGDFLLHGPRGDRTRQMLVDAMGPAIDNAAGASRHLLRVAVGAKEFDAIKAGVAAESATHTIEPFRDPEFARRQGEAIRVMFAQKTRELPPQDFVEMLRSAFKDDEWLLYAHGAILGFAGGLAHLFIFGTGAS